MKKIIALLILVIPVIMAGLGIKYMRDSVFGIVNDPFTLTVVQFIVGLLIAIFGIWFIGGYILHREQRQNRAKEKYMKMVDKPPAWEERKRKK
ncbi:DUF2627 domain-containing protein [Salinicoccus jeotgali]|uniref:DUF2627 domain-containing protein n=1 Tax=Salinicoccus jeotgali TaxID=381634 RepID=A0ABP7EWN9_9STAP